MIANLYFEQWVTTKDISQIHSRFVYKLGIVFKDSQDMAHFVRNALETSLEACEKFKDSEKRFVMLDKFINMVIICSYNWNSHPNLKIANVTDVEMIIWEVLDKYHHEKLEDFDQIPFKRILMAFLSQFYTIFKNIEMTQDFDKITRKNEILMVFANLFKKLSPLEYPAFAFSWLDIISSPCFMPFMLNSQPDFNTQEKWFKMQELFKVLFEFLKENIYENSENSPALERFFEGVMKLCAAVLHDYPEFFVRYYFELINNLPCYRTGSLRNMILAAFPKTLRMPDPKQEVKSFESSNALFTQDKTTLLKNYVDDDLFYDFKADLDNFLETGDNESLSKICEFLEESQVVVNDRKILNTGLIHATVLYLAQDMDDKKTVEEFEDPQISQKFEEMCKLLSIPVRDILLNVMFNELRLLSKATIYFMNVLLNIFKNCNEKESKTSSQVARILVERRRIPSCYPWGLLSFLYRMSKEKKFETMGTHITQDNARQQEKED
jgi:CCR4-NOT transcription complex subunit 1